MASGSRGQCFPDRGLFVFPRVSARPAWDPGLGIRALMPFALHFATERKSKGKGLAHDREPRPEAKFPVLSLPLQPLRLG
jgi:hypothetical protein